MSDTPDFDSMSPEEMMKWMESLAKRQGAAEGFTTDADMEVEEVDESDERLAGIGEYKPFGMSDEDWAKLQAKEDAEKQARLAAQQQPEPEPEPEPTIEEPIAEAVSASDDDAPDFDSMSPEEMMEWMESLAKRQGAAEGFTTSASMQVAEVDESDERLAGVGEYKPFGMSDEDWAKLQAKEDAEKQARLAAQHSAEEDEEVEDYDEELEYEDDIDEYEYVDEDEYEEYDEYYEFDEDDAIEYDEDEELVRADLSAIGLGGDDDSESDPNDFLTSLVNENDTQASEPIAELTDPDEFLSGLVDEDDEEVGSLVGDSNDFLAGLTDDDSAEDEFVTHPSDFLDSLADDEEDTVADPNDFLAGLFAGEDDAPELDFNLEGLDELEGLSELGDLGDLGDLAGLGDIVDSEAEAESSDWLAGLTEDASEDVVDFQELLDKSEGSTEWMESLAKRQGAPDDELTTSADLDVPKPETVDSDGPGYEDFSFEEATGMMQDTDQMRAIQASLDEEEDIPEMNLEDPESWLDNLAAGVADNEISDDIFDDEAFAEDDEYELEDIDDSHAEYEEHFENVKTQMDTGRLGDSPEDVDKWFKSAFERAAQRDVPDYIDEEDEEPVPDEVVDMPLQAEIPDWLKESMNVMPSDALDEDEEEVEEPAKKTATAEMMIADLGLDEDIEEPEIPDWLQGGMDEDTGIIATDIFDDQIEEAEAASFLDVTDTQDTWVEAFSQEESGELAAWYDEAVAKLEGSESTAPSTSPVVETAPVGELQAANLPIESKLNEGTPMAVPDWMGSVDMAQNVEVPATHIDDIDWLSGDDEEFEEEMPDWLKETVDDSVTEGDDLPDWLEGETDIELEDIPDWLRETMDEEEEGIVDEPILDDVFAQIESEPEPEPEPEITMPTPVAQSPAPVPVAADKIDVVAYLRSAKSKTDDDDVDGALLDYEQVIRANKALPQVEKELSKLADDSKYKRNPSVNRVLGDVMMRQGKLQEALDIYRKALNML